MALFVINGDTLTGLADKIRALLGISGGMGTDEMKTNLETEQTNVLNAFTAIGNKGGTVPTSKISGNLAASIQSIPAGVEVKTTGGEFSTDSLGVATVQCGFQPDFVYITQGYNYSHNSKTWTVSAAFAFNQESSGNVYTSFWNEDDVVTDFFANKTTDGFTLEAVTYSGDWNPSAYSGDFDYIAVKFT